MDQFLLKGSKKTSTVGGGGMMINTASKPPAVGKEDQEMKDETKPKFTPWVEK